MCHKNNYYDDTDNRDINDKNNIIFNENKQLFLQVIIILLLREKMFIWMHIVIMTVYMHVGKINVITIDLIMLCS